MAAFLKPNPFLFSLRISACCLQLFLWASWWICNRRLCNNGRGKLVPLKRRLWAQTCCLKVCKAHGPTMWALDHTESLCSFVEVIVAHGWPSQSPAHTLNECYYVVGNTPWGVVVSWERVCIAVLSHKQIPCGMACFGDIQKRTWSVMQF